MGRMIAELSRATRLLPQDDGSLKVITLVEDAQRVYFVEPQDVHLFFVLMEERVYTERIKG